MLTTALLGVLGADAAASTSTVGQNFAPDTNCVGEATYMQTGAMGNTYTVPTAGVITSWSFQTEGATISGLKLKVARPQPGGAFLFVGEAPAGAQIPTGINPYPASIPVQAGDIIGIHIAPAGGVHCAIHPGDPFDTAVGYGDDPAVGSAPTPAFSDTGGRWPVAATVTTAISPGKPRLNKKRGTATVPVSVPGPGTLTLTGKGVVTKGATQASGTGATGAADIVDLLVKSNGKTRRKLRSSGKARVTVTIGFAGTGGGSDTELQTVKLKKKGK